MHLADVDALAGQLEGAGHRQNARRVLATRDEMSDLGCDYPCLTGPGTGKNEQWSLIVENRFALSRIETF